MVLHTASISPIGVTFCVTETNREMFHHFAIKQQQRSKAYRTKVAWVQCSAYVHTEIHLFASATDPTVTPSTIYHIYKTQNYSRLMNPIIMFTKTSRYLYIPFLEVSWSIPYKCAARVLRYELHYVCIKCLCAYKVKLT